MSSKTKDFAVSLSVTCEDGSCCGHGDDCSQCLERIIAGNLHQHEGFRLSRITTTNGSRQLKVSVDLTCDRPDRTVDAPRALVGCPASADKCERCLATVVGEDIHQMDGFHVAEIVVAQLALRPSAA